MMGFKDAKAHKMAHRFFSKESNFACTINTKFFGSSQTNLFDNFGVEVLLEAHHKHVALTHLTLEQRKFL